MFIICIIYVCLPVQHLQVKMQKTTLFSYQCIFTHCCHCRHLKSELTRLHHSDPVKKSEIDPADIEFKESGMMSSVWRTKLT